MSDRIMVAVLGFLCAATIGCASAKQLYPGSARPAEEVAELRMTIAGAITRISGRDMEGRAFMLLPSTYPIEMRVIVPADEFYDVMEGYNQRAIFECEGTFDLQAGRTYRITRTRPKTTLSRTGRPNYANSSIDHFEISVFVVGVDQDGREKSSVQADCLVR